MEGSVVAVLIVILVALNVAAFMICRIRDQRPNESGLEGAEIAVLNDQDSQGPQPSTRRRPITGHGATPLAIGGKGALVR
jgi:hypothetical protein